MHQLLLELIILHHHLERLYELLDLLVHEMALFHSDSRFDEMKRVLLCLFLVMSQASTSVALP